MENGKAVKGAPRKKADEFSNPFLTQEVEIHSSPAQAVFENGYEKCDSALHSLSVVLPAVLKSDNEIMTVNGTVDHLINNAFANMRNESARLKKISEDNGIDIGRVNYTNVTTYRAKITCNKSGQYLQMIRELDKLMELVHSTWLAGFIADDAKGALERQWRRKTLGVSAEISAILARAFSAAQKLKHDVQAESDQAATDSTADNAAKTSKKKSRKMQAKTPDSAEASTPLMGEDPGLAEQSTKGNGLVTVTL
ncbi:conserved hypothetical protein [Candidatus Nitrotoga sp. HW29]|uniref:hypothetical protein n=1 Tax=Candidatus Nitrotoga sp. HW29 TaxID=2886963 RepID=UPI001EF16B40|nr:hypothetical protein [Candidatus Nitrotoga sp. HW29]CAH1906082.1 conserved hypothetical protein [Candidatus Nitrotoga sp. HW29]